jgi:hypothetical protein
MVKRRNILGHVLRSLHGSPSRTRLPSLLGRAKSLSPQTYQANIVVMLQHACSGSPFALVSGSCKSTFDSSSTID